MLNTIRNDTYNFTNNKPNCPRRYEALDATFLAGSPSLFTIAVKSLCSCSAFVVSNSNIIPARKRKTKITLTRGKFKEQETSERNIKYNTK